MSEDSEYPILYGPRDGKSLLNLYPELGENEFFKGMPKDELLFSWYMGIKGSPVDESLDHILRTKISASKSIVDPKKKQEYSAGKYPEKIKLAIEEFGRKSPEARLLAKKMVQDTFKRYQELLDVDVKKDFLITKTIGKGDEKEEITEMNWSGRKAYADTADKIMEALPGLVKKMEEGFGVNEKKKNEVGHGMKSIDLFHRNNTEN